MSKTYSAEVKRLQTEMVKRLSGHIAPYGKLKTTWEELLFALSNDNPLSQADTERVSSMQELFTLLANENFIDYGNYDRFEEILKPVHPKMASEVREYQIKIVAQIKKDSENTQRNVHANIDNAEEENDGDGDNSVEKRP